MLHETLDRRYAARTPGYEKAWTEDMKTSFLECRKYNLPAVSTPGSGSPLGSGFAGAAVDMTSGTSAAQ